ncbi:MAG: Asp23/Gls24 family envelope stress response protein [Thermoanaerobacteraceae bacterium]|nr:Asp23/Gls24 family envelope stress response protein [Thermoanaerobacteraceae bacterium]
MVEIADDVIAAIAGLSTMEVKGVASMSGGVVDGITEVIGRKNLAKGIRVKSNEKDVTIDANIIVNYGDSISDISENIQKKIKGDVEKYTGLNVVGVNIHVVGINQPGEPKTGVNDSTLQDVIEPTLEI